MKDEHVINLLESAPLGSLSEIDLATIRAHTDKCTGCQLAFQSAQVAALLLKERAGETFEPSPFFHTRVLATLRERQATVPLWTLARLWRSAGALASSMVATVAALAVLTFVIPGNEFTSVSQQASSLAQGYSAEEVILNETAQLEGQLSDDQLLNTIYGGE
jgi:hypothetical protein